MGNPRLLYQSPKKSASLQPIPPKPVATWAEVEAHRAQRKQDEFDELEQLRKLYSRPETQEVIDLVQEAIEQR